MSACKICGRESCGGMHSNSAALAALHAEILDAGADLEGEALSHTDVANWLLGLAEDVRGGKYGECTTSGKDKP